MQKLVYLCIMLPTLSFGASSEKCSNADIILKSATMVDADQQYCGDTFHNGHCYILDEDEPKMILQGVSYQVSQENELSVDVKLSPKEQERLSQLSKEFAGKRHLVIIINNKIVSAPFLKTPITGSSLQISHKKKSDLENLLKALGG